MRNKATTVTCPICNATASYSVNNPHRPFCSERCQLIDLGEWFNEERRIVGGKLAEDGQADTEDAASPGPDIIN
ncbi:MAG: DNA gyrase inhibitor YacG [Gammaproteobacteria bacterium]|nr:DNA gyrase inhibitor YacG [Gammaproteobacteria bacterium]